MNHIDFKFWHTVSTYGRWFCHLHWSPLFNWYLVYRSWNDGRQILANSNSHLLLVEETLKVSQPHLTSANHQPQHTHTSIQRGLTTNGAPDHWKESLSQEAEVYEHQAVTSNGSDVSIRQLHPTFQRGHSLHPFSGEIDRPTRHFVLLLLHLETWTKPDDKQFNRSTRPTSHDFIGWHGLAS